MAHRIGARDDAGTSHLEGDGGMELEKSRVGRRGRSVTPNVVSLWAENRRLYMDNLRLWDCLTLVRSDANITCQGAIKLVFGLGDDEYLTTFPDTKQLMQLMFPGGVVYHTCSEEARTENIRLKDENSRLHAAVWVLRDNPKLQADSTVAAIFRLTEGQFLAKFHSDIVAQDAGTGTVFNNFHVQNNNKSRKKSYRTVLDMGTEQAMAIQLTNTPVKAGPAPCSTTDRRQRCSRSVAPPDHSRRKHNGSDVHNQDFTSNWKATTPEVGCERAAGHPTIISDSQLAGDNCRQTFWRQSCQDRQVEHPYSTDGGKLENTIRKCVRCQNCRKPEDQCLQPQEAAPKRMNIRELRRSNTVSSANNILEERFHRGSSRALPIKCVSFAEPLCCYRAGCIPANEFVCFRDKVKAILDVGHDHCCQSRSKQKHTAPSCQNAAAGNVCGLTKNANSNKGNYDTDTRTRVYPAKATREPSKRYQKDVATSPVLYTQACILQSDKLPEAILDYHQYPSNNKRCTSSASDSYMLNKSSNNEDGLPSQPSPKPDICNTSTKLRENRPLFPKRRDIRQTRLKTIQSCEKIRNREAQLQQNQDGKLDTCSTNNALLRFATRRSTFERLYNANVGTTTPPPDEEPRDNDKSEVQQSSQVTSSTDGGGSIFVPEIYYSDKPAPPRGPKYVQYSIESYPTVKHFLDRHRRIEHQASSCKNHKEVFTREITPSVAQIRTSEIWTAETSRADSGTEILAANDEMQHQQMAQEYKGKWSKKESVRRDDYECGNENSWPDYSTPGVPKECKQSIWSKEEGLRELKKLGNFQYTKPLATMIKRTGCYQWKPYKGSINSRGSIALTVRSSLQSGMKVQMVPEGPFITYVPKDKKG